MKDNAVSSCAVERGVRNLDLYRNFPGLSQKCMGIFVFLTESNRLRLNNAALAYGHFLWLLPLGTQ